VITGTNQDRIWDNKFLVIYFRSDIAGSERTVAPKISKIRGATSERISSEIFERIFNFRSGRSRPIPHTPPPFEAAEAELAGPRVGTQMGTQMGAEGAPALGAMCSGSPRTESPPKC
jgi:hypothetical protein